MIKIENVCKQFDDNVVLKDINLTIEHGERVVLTGPSGQGKTTLLRLIAGLEKQDSGSIVMDEKTISFAFQNNLLLDELSAYDNISYGINHSKISKSKLNEMILEISNVFECKDYLSQKTKTLSGGQKQRVSLARAFIKNPDLLLIDEAFNSLDVNLKESLLKKVLQMQVDKNFTLLYVSHDDRDIDIIGGRCIYIEDGKIKAKED